MKTQNLIMGIILFLGIAFLLYPLLPILINNITIIAMYFVKQITVLLPYTLIASVVVFGMVKFANKI